MWRKSILVQQLQNIEILLIQINSEEDAAASSKLPNNKYQTYEQYNQQNKNKNKNKNKKNRLKRISTLLRESARPESDPFLHPTVQFSPLNPRQERVNKEKCILSEFWLQARCTPFNSLSFRGGETKVHQNAEARVITR